MEAAFAWIGAIAEWFGQFVPRILILNTTMGAVKFVRGARAVPLASGMHIWWPLTTEVITYPVARQTDNLRTQTIVTSDSHTIVVGGMVVYEVSDIEKLVAHTYHPQDTIKDVSMTAIHDVCCLMTWEELKTAQRDGRLDRRLRSETHSALKPYGIQVLKVQLTDLAPARVLKLIQSQSQDGE